MSEERGDAGKSCVFKKSIVVCQGSPSVRASRFSLGVAKGRVQRWGALGHCEQLGWVLEAG